MTRRRAGDGPRGALWPRLVTVLLVLCGYDGAGALRALDELPYPPRGGHPAGVGARLPATAAHWRLVGDEHRIDVPLAQVPPAVRQAVLAAENRGFAADPGVSVTGLASAPRSTTCAAATSRAARPSPSST